MWAMAQELREDGSCLGIDLIEGRTAQEIGTKRQGADFRGGHHRYQSHSARFQFSFPLRTLRYITTVTQMSKICSYLPLHCKRALQLQPSDKVLVLPSLCTPFMSKLRLNTTYNL